MDLDTQAKRATEILQAAYAQMESEGIDPVAALNALINLGADGLTEIHGAAFAAEQLRRHAQTVELYATATKGEG